MNSSNIGKIRKDIKMADPTAVYIVTIVMVIITIIAIRISK